MTSIALTRWQVDRMGRLGHTDAHCAIYLMSPIPPPPLAQELLEAYVMLLSGHFQGFCRDLYSESVQHCASKIPLAMQTTIQAQFTAELALNTRNPTHETIRKDFERFGFSLDLNVAAPGNPLRVTHLGHLNYWRNHVAHQKATPPPTGVPPLLTLASIRDWRNSCDGLAISLDDIMKQELTRVLGASPW